jgi:hypothetical protein
VTGHLKRWLAVPAAAGLALCLASPAGAAVAWTVQAVPLPAGATSGNLSGVSCLSATDCIAVGFTASGTSGGTVPLAEQWNGSTWTALATPLPSGGTTGVLNGVSCVAADCTAVGYYDGSTGGPLAEQWNGSNWSIQPVPLSAGLAGSLSAVSCVSAANCFAVGSDSINGEGSQPLAEEWNGSNWTMQAAPDPLETASAELAGISCVSAVKCAAVGGSRAGSGQGSTLAEEWNGSKWSIKNSANESGAIISVLSGVSCYSLGNCTAVGDYSSSVRTLLVEHWNGSVWSVETASAPTGSSTSDLTSVSCPIPASCTAVGTFTKTTGETRPLAEFWNGSTWATQSTPQAADKNLEGISCTLARTCTSAGENYHPAAGLTPLLAEQEL